VEAVGQWHTGANIAEEPLKLLVIDIVEQGQTNTCCTDDPQKALRRLSI
jgi:hypothetical protein